MNVRRAIGAIAASLLIGCQTVEVKPRAVEIAVQNVTVIDPQTGTVLRSRDVVVSGDQIVAVVPTSERKAFVAARVVDGTGRFLIPGLVDMHVHLFLPDPAEPTLALLLANGVTGIREMSSDCWAAAGATRGCIADYKQVQAKARGGELAGPELLALTSTMVMGPSRLKLPPGAPSFITPNTAAQAKQLAGYLAARGVDLIKTHDSIPAEAFFALMGETSRRGLAVGGHVPFGAGSLGAARAGYRSIEHARDLLYDCSGFGAEFRQREDAVVRQVKGAARPKNLERLHRTVNEHDQALCGDFLKHLARTGAYYVPTHVTREMEARASELAYRNDPARKYILPERNRMWEADLQETAALPEAERDALGRFFQHGLLITGLAHRAGVPVMAGTDASDTMIVPGFSLHRELLLLRRGGLSPMEVLRAATTTPARYFRRADLGGIAAGKQADLVLLGANPLKDIRFTASIDAVIARGRLFDRAALDGLLKSAEPGPVPTQPHR